MAVKRIDVYSGTDWAALKIIVDAALAIAAAAAAIPRVVRATATGVGTPGSSITVGGLTGLVGTAFAVGADAAGFATNLRTWLNTNKATIPATTVVDNGDGTVDITFAAGVAANAYPTTENDANLAFTQTTPGSDAVETATLFGFDTYMVGGQTPALGYVVALQKTTA